ncbi:MAG: hypothetical protein J6K87_03415, partial [Clostridia bacterium]|nr:hypothetical protein [Clostridia bacterium]
VFEFKIKSPDKNIDNLVICGGGRYDKLSEIFGGPNLPALGLGIGLERLVLAMESQDILFPEVQTPEIFIICLDNNSRLLGFKLCDILRKSGIFCELDILNRNLKSQLKYADKIKSKYVIIIGEEELKTKKSKLKDMRNNNNINKEYEISIDPENFLEKFMSIYLSL